jgi:hypothetical protein
VLDLHNRLMKKSMQLVVLAAALNICGDAQDVPPRPSSNERQDLLMRELVNRQLEQQGGRSEIEAAERWQEQYEERRFLERANKFARIWSAFAKEYNENRTFNAKTAEKITRAFHELEASKDWPRLSAK